MKRLKRVLSGTTAAVLSLSSMLTMGFSGVAHAAAQTCTWTGTAGDSKFSTVTNWSNCGGGTPQTGDIVSFDAATSQFDVATSSTVFLVNDLGVSLGGVSLKGKSAWSGANEVGLSTLMLVDGGTITFIPDSAGFKSMDLTIGTDSSTLTNLAGTGTLNVEYASSITNPVMISSAGATGVTGLHVTGSGSTRLPIGYLEGVTNYVLNKASLRISADNSTKALNLDMTDSAIIASGSAFDPSPKTLTLSGPITLHGDAQFFIGSSVELRLTGSITGGTITKTADSGGTLVIGTQAVEQPVKTTDCTDSQPNAIYTVAQNETFVLKQGCERSSVDAMAGSIVKGSAVILHALSIAPDAIVAPGFSPGCLTSDTLSIAGTYAFEIGGTDPCTGYDQLIVNNASSAVTAVTLSNTTSVLSTARYNNYTPKQGQSFTIINQAGTAAVSGTFNGLPEGATFTQNGVVFKITYKGGDGNDVVLTVQNQPTAPDTGFALISANPIATLAVTAGAGLALIALARKTRPAPAQAHARRRK